MGGGQTASLDYGNELPQPYHGEYSLTRAYSVRSIVAFHESAKTHGASLVEKDSEAVIRTTEISTLSERHARFENGIYTYPYEPIPCGSERTPGRVVTQGFGSPLKPVTDIVSMPKVGDSFRLNLDLGQHFDSQKPECGGSADLALHRNEGADSPVAEVGAPPVKFLQIASAGDHKSHEFNVHHSIKHGGLAGLHTFENQLDLVVRLSWFPPDEIARERKRLRSIECGFRSCQKDNWGK